MARLKDQAAHWCANHWTRITNGERYARENQDRRDPTLQEDLRTEAGVIESEEYRHAIRGDGSRRSGSRRLAGREPFPHRGFCCIAENVKRKARDTGRMRFPATIAKELLHLHRILAAKRRRIS